MIALDPDTGKLKFYHQELPHDAWDFDSAVGEFVMLDRDGKQVRRASRTRAAIFSSTTAQSRRFKNVWPLIKNINFVKDIDPKTGELIGRRDFAAGKVDRARCARPSPAASAGTRGSYNPKTGLYYKIGQEWCMTFDVVKTTPVTNRRRS